MMVLLGILVGLAGLPLAMFAINTWLYRPLKPILPTLQQDGQVCKTSDPAVSLLIPARNEEQGIAACIASALAASEGVNCEVLVMDDHSTDRTADRVHELAARDDRVRLLMAPPLPEGWCGKQHACYQLGLEASHDLLVWIDADVRLQPQALVRIAGHMQTHPRTALLSGVPRQNTGSFLEHLLIPLIHVVLLGYLPMFMMKWSNAPKFSAGCGQLFIARKQAYLSMGGHGHPQVRSSLHDGVTLPRSFRGHCLHTDLCDATDLATCRMYQGAVQTWRGLGKNATEGMASAAAILPWTLLLLGGHVLPWLGLVLFHKHSMEARLCLIAVMMTLGLRAMLAARFQQSALGVILHPVSVLLLILMQWQALWRSRLGKGSDWKGRQYATLPASQR